MDPAQVHLQTAERAKNSLAALARDPAKRPYVPINYRAYLRAASGYSLRTSPGVKGYVAQLERFEPLEALSALLELIESDEFPALFASCSADDVDIVAIPLLLGRHDLSRRYLEGFLLKSSRRRVWMSYVEGLGAIARGVHFSPISPAQPKGMEKHWLRYVDLMAAIAGGNPDIRPAKEAVEASFQRCNSDKRLTETSHIDPNGTHPVQWDLRLAYVLAAAGLGPNNSSKPTPLRGAA